MSTATLSVRRRTIVTKNTAPYVFLAPVLILFVAFKLYPYVYSFWLSLTRSVGGRQEFAGAENYVRLLQDPLFFKALGNTALVLLIQVPIMLALAVALAVGFNSTLLRWRGTLRLAFFLPIVMGLVAYGILFSTLLNTQYGLVNWVLGGVGIEPVPWLGDPMWARVSIILALTWHYTGYNAVIYLAQLQTVPRELYEAASTDGAGPWRRFVHITLPGLRPAILLTVVLSTIGTLQLFDEPYVLTNGGPDNATLTIGMYLYQNGFRYFDFGYASTIAYALALLVALISFAQFRLLGRRS
ncbi:carbohydrate ABC transporter permease [Oerskovia flava]|uniref:carbohydrate ABC transporter permease n=1 Tax=Oerskovia flava TaxID=2986422 RepID=UPI0022409A07|nr:sugar ABC transporter permease [Oerskovia sp. JB1-3-2]